MGLADTARLAVQLDLTGNFTGGLTAAESRLAGFNSTVSSGVSRVTTATGKLSGALGHAGGQIKGLITGPLGLIGLGTALFSVGGAIEEGVKRAITFGDEVRQMSAVTGLSAETTSALAAAMEHFNIPADTAIRLTGFLEKNVGLLAAKKNGIADFYKTYNFALTDQNGHLKDANELLLTSADYFNNKAIPASEKAAAMSKLYGRSWQELIPFLKAGRQGISDAEAEAKNLGLTLTGDNVTALAKLKTATRDWGTALGGLELQIGLTLVPELTKLAEVATRFVSEHRADIVGFFRDAAKFAEEAGGTIGNLVGAIGSFWNGLPPAFRQILVTGVVADRSFKFLFGFDPLSLGKSLFGGVFGQFAARGSSPANPMFVSGGGIGGPGGPGGSGWQGLLIGGALAVSIVGIAAEVADAMGFRDQRKNVQDAYGLTNVQALALQIQQRGGLDSMDLRSRQGALQQFLDAGTTYAKALASAQAQQGKVSGSAINADRWWQDMAPAIAANTAAVRANTKAPWLASLEASWRKAGQTMHDKIQEAIKGLTGPHSAAAALFLGANLGSHGFGAGGLPQAEAILAELKKMNQSPAVVKAIHELEAKLPRLRTDAKDLAAAEKIAQDSDPKNKKLDQLNRIMADLNAHGDRTTRAKVSDLIAAVKHQKFTVLLPVNVRMPTIVDYGHNSTGRTVQKIVTRSGNWNIS